MNETKRLATEFLQWWVNPQSSPGFSSQFMPGFVFRMEPVGLADQDAVWLVEQKLPWSGVEVKSQHIEGEMAVLVIEGVDPVTELRHRVGFSIVVRAGRIASVTERIEILS
ncbi:hypothetical protein ACLESD_10110 [Pyxidicoccus sp. 3LFB2]